MDHHDAPKECPLCSLYRRTAGRIDSEVESLRANAEKEHRLADACRVRGRSLGATSEAVAEYKQAATHLGRRGDMQLEIVGLMRARLILAEEHRVEAHP